MNEATKKAIMIEVAKKVATVKSMNWAIEGISESLKKHITHRANAEKQALELLNNFGDFTTIPNEKEVVRMVKRYGAEEVLIETGLEE